MWGCSGRADAHGEWTPHGFSSPVMGLLFSSAPGVPHNNASARQPRAATPRAPTGEKPLVCTQLPWMTSSVGVVWRTSATVFK